MKQKHPNHLGIHGDTVHIVNNAAKALVKPFGQYVEQITDDVFNDIQCQPKCRKEGNLWFDGNHRHYQSGASYSQQIPPNDRCCGENFQVGGCPGSVLQWLPDIR